MVLIAVVLAVLVGAAVGVVGALALLARQRDELHDLAAHHDAVVGAALQQLQADREQSLQSTVDTVLAVAGDKLQSHTALAQHELGLRSAAFGERVDGMNDELRRVRQLVADLQKEKAEQHGQLLQGIHEAIRASATLTDTAQALREALSNSRARGQWGERMADDVLRAAGLVEGVSYRRQQTLPGGTRPDFTFLLPRGRALHMDVKFPIDNYLRSLDASSDPERDAACGAFLKDVRARVRELSDRSYCDPDSTVGYVLLFIPNEAVYAFVHQNDPGLVDEALGRQVVLCSPFTLFAVLGVVRQAVDNFLIERTSTEILECLAGFSGQWQQFSDRLDRLGAQFATAQRSYDELAGTRRRQLQKQLDRIDRLRTTTAEADALDELDTREARQGLAPLEPLDRQPGPTCRSSTARSSTPPSFDERSFDPVSIEAPRAVGDGGVPPASAPPRVARLRPLR